MPGTVPTRSDTVLVSNMTYNAAGWVDTTTDPKALVTARYYDLMGRTGVIPPVASSLPAVTNSTDRATTWSYDGLSHIYQLTALMPSGANSQTTQYNYGVTYASPGNDLSSDDLLASIQYPDRSTGSAFHATRGAGHLI